MATNKKTPFISTAEIIATLEGKRDQTAANVLSFLKEQVEKATYSRDDFLKGILERPSHTLQWSTSQMVRSTLVLSVLPEVIGNMESEPQKLHLYLENVCNSIEWGLSQGVWASRSSSEMANLICTWEWEERCVWLARLKILRKVFDTVETGLKAQGREMFHVEHHGDDDEY